MSIDLNWETLTTGPDGEALAESIRTFIHTKFQTVQLPRFIRSVNVHGFDFGTIPPELELKDITDPLPDFYEQDDDDDDDDDDEEDGDGGDEEGGESGGDEKSFAERERDRDRDRDREKERLAAAMMEARRRENGLRELRSEMNMNMGGGLGMGTGMGLGLGSHMNASTPNMHTMNMSPGMNLSGHDLGRAFLGTSTPGILGVGGQGRSNYFQAHLATGTQTPLAAVAGAHLGAATGWMGGSMTAGSWSAAAAGEQAPSYHSREASLSSIDNLQAVLGAGQDAGSGQQGQQQQQGQSMAKSDVSSTLGPPSRPSTSNGPGSGSAVEDDDDDDDDDADNERRREPRVEDVQAVFRIRYSGDVRLNLTAEILLDYPMPSFVGIPLKLNITGLTFDGVGVLAHIRKRVHFCFLNPDDALAAVGPEAAEEASTTATTTTTTSSTAGGGTGGGGDLQASSAGKKQPAGRFGGLLQEIKVESEIGERESGRQSLKNVGKVERFVLEQVRRIFEEEFVYPSFWTFLV
ncbi:hypothetical protein MKX07_004790 [Trichoderma sp. CBMAI-0711]|nr:hypothetical protein MKX07_004790 [Trichoderma sp. CBMAI-0711]